MPGLAVALNRGNDEADEITDPISTFNFLFLAGDTPPAPFPACGPDPTPPSGHRG